MVTLLAAAIATDWAATWAWHKHGSFDLRIYRRSVMWWDSGRGLYAFTMPHSSSLGFTYPPFTAILMTPLGWLSAPAAIDLEAGLIIGALIVVTRWVLPNRIMKHHGLAIWVVAGALTPLLFVMQPIRDTFSFGQVNLYLAILILADMRSIRRHSPWSGIGIGLATAIKLTPGVFVLYLVVTGRIRAAIVAIGTASAAALVAAGLAPRASWEYWTRVLWQARRVGTISSPTNQSLYGLIARLVTDDLPGHRHAGILLWLAVAVPALAAGLILARRCFVVAGDLPAFVVVGLLGCLVSPISWIHHLYWVAPACILLVGHAAAHRRAGYWVAAAVSYGAFVYSPVDAFRRYGAHGYLADAVRALAENSYTILLLALVVLVSWVRTPSLGGTQEVSWRTWP